MPGEETAAEILLSQMRDFRQQMQSVASDVSGLKMEVNSVKQTLHGPPGSNNGLYKSVKDLGEKVDKGFQEMNRKFESDVMPVIRDTKKGMTFREKMWLILIAAITSGLVGAAFNFFGAT